MSQALQVSDAWFIALRSSVFCVIPHKPISEAHDQRP